MNMCQLFKLVGAIVTCIAISSAHAADVAAGKAVAQRQCKECHDAGDWQGEDAASLASLMKDIISGKIKHKRPLQLSDTDIANIAAYWARGEE